MLINLPGINADQDDELSIVAEPLDHPRDRDPAMHRLHQVLGRDGPAFTDVENEGANEPTAEATATPMPSPEDQAHGASEPAFQSPDVPDSSTKSEKYVFSAYPAACESHHDAVIEVNYQADYDLNDPVPRSPDHNLSTLLATNNDNDNKAYLIADTGCQKMVAGPSWHDQRVQDILPLKPIPRVSHCSFTFGPSEPTLSSESFDYPAGIAQHVVLLNVSRVEHEAPGLFSRPGFVQLGAIPNLLRGEMHFLALNRSTPIYLTTCGHICFRIDDWPASDEGDVTDFWPISNPDLQETVAPTAAILTPANLNPLPRQARFPGHASPSTEDFSTMAAQMAASAVEAQRVHPSSRSDGDVRSSTLSSTSALRSSTGTFSSHDGFHTSYDSSTDAQRRGDADGATTIPTATSKSAQATRKTDAHSQSGRVPGSDQRTTARWPSRQDVDDIKDENSTDRQPRRRCPTVFHTISWLGKLLTLLGSLLSAADSFYSFEQGNYRDSSFGIDPFQSAESFATSTSSPSGGTTPATPDRAEPGASLVSSRTGSSGPRLSQHDQHAGAGGSTGRGLRGAGTRGPPKRTISRPQQGSTFDPLTKDDIKTLELKTGTRKRICGETRKVADAINWELKVYENRTEGSQRLLRHAADLLQVYPARTDYNCGPHALARGLRVVVNEGSRDHVLDHKELTSTVNQVINTHPVLTVIDFPFDYLDETTHLNACAMASLSGHLDASGGLVLMSLPEWVREIPELTDLINRSHWSMTSRWLTNSSELFQALSDPDLTNFSDKVIFGLESHLKDHGDIRFATNPQREDFRFQWTVNLSGWCPAGPAPNYQVYYLDAVKDIEMWRPVLQEVKAKLSRRASLSSISAVLKANNPLYEKVRLLVPWELHHVQIYHLPKQRRVPPGGMDASSHRGAALLLNDGVITVETEAIATVAGAPAQRFQRPVEYGIFFYGNAPATGLDAANLEPEASKPKEDNASAPLPNDLNAEDEIRPHQPGGRDITFPGLPDSVLPAWVKAVLRRLHTNLGHPTNASLVRQIAQANGSSLAIMGARGLRCAVCARMSRPKTARPGKLREARNLNDRIIIDLIFVDDCSGYTWTILSILDDASTFHALARLLDRGSKGVIDKLVNGWFAYLGIPDEILTDAEGAFKSYKFDDLTEQTGIKVRFVPKDAHWQLGKGERHGATVKYIFEKTASQFGITEEAEVDIALVMTADAKNSLINRSGSSPAQWMLGRNKRIPGSLMSDAENVEEMSKLTQSQKLMRIQEIRYGAMHNMLNYDSHIGLMNAMLRKGRPLRGPFEPGQRIAYWRDDSGLPAKDKARRVDIDYAGYRKGTVLSRDPTPTGDYYVRSDRGRMVLVAPEQMRALEGEELWTPDLSDLELLRDAGEKLQTASWVYDHRQQGPSESSDSGQVPREDPPPLLDPQGNPLAPGEAPVLPAVIMPVPHDDDGELDEIAPAAAAPSGEDTAAVSPPPALALSPIPEEGTPAEPLAIPAPDNTVTPLSDQPSMAVSSPRGEKRVPSSTRSEAPIRKGPRLESPSQSSRDSPEGVNVNVTNQKMYDRYTKSLRGRKLFPKIEHLPSQDELDEIWKLEKTKWYDDEVVKFTGTQVKPAQRTHSGTHGLRSVAVRPDESAPWIWMDVMEDTFKEQFNIDNDLEDELYENNHVLQDCQSLVLYHQHRFIEEAIPDKTVYLNDYWQYRQSRARCTNLDCGWDGTPEEVQSGFTRHTFEQVAYLSEVETTVPEDNLSQDGWSTDEEGGDGCPSLTRAEKKALKREIPWRHIDPEDTEQFVQAVVKEWAEWIRYSSCRKMTIAESRVIARHLILPARTCFKWKILADGYSRKAKARIVVQGFRDPHLPLLARDAPVLARLSLMAVIQWAANYGLSLWNADASNAFLQGMPDDERPEHIYMKPPKDPISTAAVPEFALDVCYELWAPVYGQANAPRRWFMNVVRIMLSLGWIQHSLDPCLFLLILDQMVVAVLGIHVDDIIAAILDDYFEHLMKVKDSFQWGNDWVKDNFIFTGRRIMRSDNGSYRLDQLHYVSDLDVGKVSKHLDDKTLLVDTDGLVTDFRSGSGSLQWLSGMSRPDVSADTSLSQRSVSELTVADLKVVNSTLKYVKATAEAYITINKFDWDSFCLVPYGDASWANAPGNKSQGALLVVGTDKKAMETTMPASILEWKSHRLKRVLRSTLAAEAASQDISVDHASFLGCVLSEMIDPEYKASMRGGESLIPVYPVTDCRSLYDAVHRLSTTFQEKRTEIDVACLRQTAKALRWVPTSQQWADALTKRDTKLRNQLRIWMMDPKVCLVETKSPEDDHHFETGKHRLFDIKLTNATFLAIETEVRNRNPPHGVPQYTDTMHTATAWVGKDLFRPSFDIFNDNDFINDNALPDVDFELLLTSTPSCMSSFGFTIPRTPLLHDPSSSFWSTSQEYFANYGITTTSSTSSSASLRFPSSSSAGLLSSTLSSATSHKVPVLSSPVRRKRLKKDFWECLSCSSYQPFASDAI